METKVKGVHGWSTSSFGNDGTSPIELASLRAHLSMCKKQQIKSHLVRFLVSRGRSFFTAHCVTIVATTILFVGVDSLFY